MREVEAVADEAAAKEKTDKFAESDSKIQENHLKTGRSTPKSVKKEVQSCSSHSVSSLIYFHNNLSDV